MGWHAALRLDYTCDAECTRARSAHTGPLRVLKALYPEGEAICHHVLVHPPAGLVGGDRLEVEARLGAGSHALLTTPGATRWYRSQGDEATQQVRLHLGEGARLEWLPLETLAYDGARAVNDLQVTLASGAAMIGWDLLALGLPAADAPFATGHFDQRIAIDGLWLEQARIDASDRLLLDSPLGLAGQRTLATAWLAWGSDPAEARVTQAIEGARALIEPGGAFEGTFAGVTRAQPRLIVLRALAGRTEPLFHLLRAVRAAWRSAAWDLPAAEPRVWRT
ncbi:urease accessory protein UreD [Sphaerotilus microaerophilus]|uniref:Urease accessory protein UreD n=1 Tax=Sphaerotilus microaerophilus TaxID=2914710 RepID=A0ABM7YR94_9BURK|nr:urease accessory protein UreD [Sphaerotilus sp. FB-5]BDI07096.1 urease accessory protein UreD [Sphaerotilus sp. FB-5]